MANNLFLSDVDGTLIDLVPVMNQKDVQAIDAWIQEGNAFGLVTGRDIHFCHNLMDKYELDAQYFITSNGASTYIGDTCIDTALIDKKRSLEIYRALYSYYPDVVFFFTDEKGNRYFPTSIMSDDEYAEYQKRCHHLKPFMEQDVLEYLETRDVGCTKISINTVSPEKNIELLPVFQSLFPDVEVMATAIDYIEITKKGIHKGYALDHLLNYESFDSIYYVGDSANDIPMFEKISNSFVMSSADALVKEKARYEVSSVKEAIEKAGRMKKDV